MSRCTLQPCIADACCGTRHLRLYRAPLSLPRRLPTLSFSLQPHLLSHHLLHNRRKNPKENRRRWRRMRCPLSALPTSPPAHRTPPRPGPRRCFQRSRWCISHRRIGRHPHPGPRRLGPLRTSAVRHAGEPLRH
jgi:hypothetical protein